MGRQEDGKTCLPLAGGKIVRLKNFDMVKHIAIIMDGNRRWAKAHFLPVCSGHKKVLDDVLEPLIEHSAKLNIKYLTFWAFSTENWQRDKKEVSVIMQLFKLAINKWLSKMHKKNIRIKFIGDISKFDSSLKIGIEKAIIQTQNNTGITVVFAINYGGRDEIIRAVNKAIRQSESLSLKAESFPKFLDTFDIPDPEMIIRTGGEKRLSGFLLWQSEYSELFFPEFMMPDFTPDKLDELIEEYNSRQRRYGK